MGKVTRQKFTGTGIHGGGIMQGRQWEDIQDIESYVHKVKHAGNELNKERSHMEQYPCMGMHLRWPVMHRERIPRT